MTLITGKLIPHWRAPYTARTVLEGPEKYTINYHHNGIVSAVGQDGVSGNPPPVVLATAVDAQKLDAFLRRLVIPGMMGVGEFEVKPGALLRTIAARQDQRVIDLTDQAYWNFPCGISSATGVELWLVTAGFIPRGLEFATAWASFKFNDSSRTGFGASTDDPHRIMARFHETLVACAGKCS